MLEFFLGIVITDEEYEMMAEPITHVERCMLLTNDYWSWPRERKQAEMQEAGKIFNIVWFLMKTEPCTEEDAVAKVREMVYAEEQKWTAARNRLYSQLPGLRPDLVKFLENLHTALAGNGYWSSQCYRHNDWTHIPELPGDDAPKLNELAALGQSLVKEEPMLSTSAPVQKIEVDSARITTRKRSADMTSGGDTLSNSKRRMFSEDSASQDSTSSTSTPPNVS